MDHQQEYDDVLRARFTKWLDTVIYRAKLKYLRKTETKLDTVSLEELPERILPVYEDDLRQIDSMDAFAFEEERLADAFANLLIKRQRILTMLFVEERKPEEIAKELNCSPQHVYDQRYHALKKLRTELMEEGDGR